MAHLPLRREALTSFNPVAMRQQRAGREVLEQMFAYFDFDDLPVLLQQDEGAYDRAA